MRKNKLYKKRGDSDWRKQRGPVQRMLDNTLINEKLAVMFYSLIRSSDVWDGLVVALGFMFIGLAFSFFPTPILLLLTVIFFIAATKHPGFTTILGMVINLPAISYQSPFFAWLFLLAIAFTLFKVKRWKIISFLFIIIFSPFAPFPFSLMVFLVFTLLIIFSLYLGSKESILISLPSIFLIMLLSSLWLTPNRLGIPVRLDLYYPAESLLIPSLPAVTVNGFIPMLFKGYAEILNREVMFSLGNILSTVARNIGKLLVYDSSVIQLLVWGVVLFLIAYIPGIIRRYRWKQTVSSLFIFLIPLTNLFLTQMYNTSFNFSMFLSAGISVTIIFILEYLNVQVSRERLLFLRKRAKRFGFLGLIDLEESAPDVKSLSDVGDYEEVKEELKRTIMLPLEHQDVSFAYGIKPPSGVLLFGPPGTGKTFIMTALAKELDIGFFYVKASNLLSKGYGQTEKNLVRLIETARRNAPCILFFDELEAIGRRRDLYTSDDTGPRMLSVLLQELDGFKYDRKAILIGATNAPHLLDPALLRPGRFDKLIYMPLPDSEARREIFKIYLKNLKLSDDVDLEKLVDMTEGYSGADIKNICKESASSAAERAVKEKRIVSVEMKDFECVLRHIKPSVSAEELEKYELFRKLYDRTLFREVPEEEADQRITFKDVIGLDDVKRLLKESMELPFKHPELLKKYEVKPVKGILMFGPPGCGKTMVVKAASNELDVPMFSFSAADLVRYGSDLAVKEVKKIFNNARSRAPSIVFIDEIDHLIHNDVIGGAVLSQLLVELDGVRRIKDVIVVASSNRPWRIEPALVRPGRFDRIIYVPEPGFKTRRQLFLNNLAQVNVKLNYDKLAELTCGYSSADIVSICQEVKLRLVRSMLGTGPNIKIDTDYVVSMIKRTPPSINLEMIAKYRNFARSFERKG